MCFHYSMSQVAKNLENRYHAPFTPAVTWEPRHHVNGFNFPLMPVVHGGKERQITLLQWGLVPSWIRDPEQAAEIRGKTLNARSESAFEKPSFRKSLATRRCLVPADGFFEWQSVGTQKIPWFITLSGKEVFSFGGLWDIWEYPERETLHTFSILTTDANPLMAEIHNTKKRMPLILPEGSEGAWLDEKLPRQEVETLMVPFPEEGMKAWTISTLITARGADTNTPEVKKPWSYAPSRGLF
ncbi:MAG TPA: SOS response-associated peptidase [Prolixibacteraceae bacterium]|mgnify:CR=1 FL=1|nr:SOS response-associated peptidase [Bacteroidales bacterium]HNQ37491.1 SOS response-associated peptidase [Prolixibacteraceae bacterium]HOY51122.1 SOS response-associated peptidase [Prolixibacteraceae bacterium]